MERRLAAILAADVVGYSALMERDEAGTFARLRAGRRDLFEPEIDRHHGRIFKLMGDGLLAEFSSVVNAVECAVSLQRALAERNAFLSESEQIQVRIGVNLGEVIVDGDDRYGEGVNIATRLEQLAEAGDVYVSGKVAKEVAKKLAFGFEAMGDQKVKNIREPLAVYRVTLHGDATPKHKSRSSLMTRSRVLAAGLIVVTLISAGGFYWFRQWSDHGGSPTLPDKPSIAVLPFTNLSDDPKQVYFADGIAEDLMTDLSRLSGLSVVSRNSAFAYRGKEIDLRTIGRDLGVGYILEGSVRRAGDRVRINVQLIDANTGGHRWAERYDGSQADIFALQDNVTKAVVSALALQLTPGEQVAVDQHETNIPEAYDAFLRGWEHYQRTTPQDFINAIPYFEQAIKFDPTYGRAHAALAMVYFRSYDQRWSGYLGLTADAAFRKARDHLSSAKTYPTSLYHQVAGNISRERGWFEDAYKEFAAAIALEPSDSWSYVDLAYSLIWAGKPAEALQQIETAMRLDPRHPPIFLFYQGLAQFAQDRLPESADAFEEAFRLNPDTPWVGLFLASTYAKMGRVEDAAAVVAAYSAARVRQGSVPFVMREVKHPSAGNAPEDIRPPEKGRLVQGLDLINIPYNFDAPEFATQRVNGGEIKALLFGHRVQGRSRGVGGDYGMFISPDDGSVTHFGIWDKGAAETAYVKNDRLCLVQPTTEWCAMVFRNPGGSRAKENEYFFFEGWATTFSRIE
jgi:TolB-like protein/class 3 adenylate cyclase